ncbi:MAG: acyl-CoA dehydrogenase family protein [Pseudomonadota bacterium]|nr:acyl-CoA dehydrogenase family protein [Pseudomonadota bacterium]
MTTENTEQPKTDFILSEEQTMLRDTAKQFFSEQVPISNLRKLRDEESVDGIDREVWKQAAELGLAGILIPEAYGGTDFGVTGMGLVMEEAGRTLAATPLFSSSILSTLILLEAASEDQKQAILPAIAKGEMIVAVALEESGHHNPAAVSMSAEKKDAGFVLNGRKTFVLDGHIADKLIIVARSSGQKGDINGLSLCLVDADAEGLKVTHSKMVDTRNSSEVTCENLTVSADMVIGTINDGAAPLERALDQARILLSAEILGGVNEVFERTLEYLKERKQFGVPIGSFQALRHRASAMFSEIEICKAVVTFALSQSDKKSNQIARLASLTKARLGEASTLVTNEGLQMHGGIGMTDDVDIGLFMKRARVQLQLLGDPRFHRERYARLNGY